MRAIGGDDANMNNSTRARAQDIGNPIEEVTSGQFRIAVDTVKASVST